MESLINEWLSYDKATGRFHWKKSPNNKDIEDASNAYLKRKREIHLTNTL